MTTGFAGLKDLMSREIARRAEAKQQVPVDTSLTERRSDSPNSNAETPSAELRPEGPGRRWKRGAASSWQPQEPVWDANGYPISAPPSIVVSAARAPYPAVSH
jgi:hypothetical protein